jgi:hypothetical protein
MTYDLEVFKLETYPVRLLVDRPCTDTAKCLPESYSMIVCVQIGEQIRAEGMGRSMTFDGSHPAVTKMTLISSCVCCPDCPP